MCGNAQTASAFSSTVCSVGGYFAPFSPWRNGIKFTRIVPCAHRHEGTLPRRVVPRRRGHRSRGACSTLARAGARARGGAGIEPAGSVSPPGNKCPLSSQRAVERSLAGRAAEHEIAKPATLRITTSSPVFPIARAAAGPPEPGPRRGETSTIDRLPALRRPRRRFKEVNDRLGHSAGDKLLQRVAERLLSCVRVAIRPVATGGDEFVLLLARGRQRERRVGRRRESPRPPGQTVRRRRVFDSR